MASMFITGGSAGLGAETARQAAARGYDVGISYRSDRDGAESVVAEVRRQGQSAELFQGDVSSASDCARMMETHVSAFGPPDVAVLNAGIVPPRLRSLADADPAEIERVVAVNTTGLLFVAREAARVMPHAAGGRGGSIIVMGSVATRIGSAFEFVDYAASKAACDALVLGLAKELGPDGVRVCGIRPGLIDTEIHAKGGAPDRADRLGAQMPLGRAGTAREVAEAVLFLASDASSYTTGTWLDIAGGR
ncbi:MAG: SDR family oxidoreductase [Pseudomonadota bacterium]